MRIGDFKQQVREDSVRMDTQSEWNDVAIAWEGEFRRKSDRRQVRYVSMVAKRDIKEGEKVFLVENTSKKSPKAPDFTCSERVEKQGEAIASANLADDIPF